MGINIVVDKDMGGECRLPSSTSLHSTHVSQERRLRTALAQETRNIQARHHHSGKFCGRSKAGLLVQFVLSV